VNINSLLLQYRKH